MENKNAERVFGQPDQHTYYNAVQLSLPVNTLISLEKDDPVFAFLEAIESIDFSRYVRPVTSNNTRSHDRGMLVKVLLFGYMNGVESVNELSRLCCTDLRYLYLSSEERPSAMAFSRVCNQLMTSIDSLFFDLSGEITALLDINTSTQFVDGTKIEANAQKNTFVYRKRIVNARDRLSLMITESIKSLDHACYNCQIAVADGIIVNSEVYQTPSDAVT